ncbi:MAG: nuclear transport factor 2 family protein [Rubrobacteraceae bacterium]
MTVSYTVILLMMHVGELGVVFVNGSGGTAGGGPREALDRMLPLLRDKDLDGLADLYSEDGVHELPFAPPGAPRRIEGRERIRAYFASTLSDVPLDFREFRPVAIHDAADPEVIVAEYDAHGEVTTTGLPFTVRYLWVLRVSGGEILSWRDYWNPLEILELQGLLPSLISRLTEEDDA